MSGKMQDAGCSILKHLSIPQKAWVMLDRAAQRVNGGRASDCQRSGMVRELIAADLLQARVDAATVRNEMRCLTRRIKVRVSLPKWLLDLANERVSRLAGRRAFSSYVAALIFWDYLTPVVPVGTILRRCGWEKRTNYRRQAA